MNPSLFRPALALLAGSVLATGLFAQSPAPKLEFPAASPAATLKQRVGLTDIEINYSRPSVRGRKIFGGLEAYGAVWRTGANSATKISFSTPVKFGGADVPAGDYALFTIPDPAEWTVILNKVNGQWGAYTYDEKNDLVRVKVKPVALPKPVETFAIGISDIQSSAATLYLAWENTRVPIALGFDVVGQLVPQLQTAMAAEGKKPYFSAAMFYYEYNHDLPQAAKWMDAAIAENPGQLWMIYRKGLILEKLGDQPGARAAAEESLALATKAGGSIGAEYVRLNQALLGRLK